MRSFVLHESKHTSLEKGYKHGRNRGTLSSMLQDRKRLTGQEGAAWNCSMETAGGHQAVPLLSKELKSWKIPQLSLRSLCGPITESTFFHQQIYHCTCSNSWQKDRQEDPKDIIILTVFTGGKGQIESL